MGAPIDPELAVAARALAAGDPLTALKRVALRDDPPALALHGVAMAQLGELGRAAELLRRAARGFGPREAVARARCVVARAEVALAARELAPDHDRVLEAAAATLEAHGDRGNALHGRLIAIRRWLVLGRIELAEQGLVRISLVGAPAALAAIGELIVAELAVRRVRGLVARAALARAGAAAARAGIPALRAEIALAVQALDAPAARVVASGVARLAGLDEVEAVLASDALVVDAFRRVVRVGKALERLAAKRSAAAIAIAAPDAAARVSFARRPVLFALVRALAEAWPDDVSREALIARAFDVRRANDSHRARLRVELGRLRRELRGLAEIRATTRGYAIIPQHGPQHGSPHGSQHGRAVLVLVPPIDGPDAALLALLGDGEAWSTPALALALGLSQRTLQRTLADLEATGRVRSRGDGRARRWLAPPVVGFSTTLLLPATPIG